MPIETIVIISMAVLVLIVISALFLSTGGKNYSLLDNQRALAQGCNELVYQGCDPRLVSQLKIPEYDATCGDAVAGTLQAACCTLQYEYKAITSVSHCAYTACRCPTTGIEIYPGDPPDVN